MTALRHTRCLQCNAIDTQDDYSATHRMYPKHSQYRTGRPFSAKANGHLEKTTKIVDMCRNLVDKIVDDSCPLNLEQQIEDKIVDRLVDGKIIGQIRGQISGQIRGQI